MLAIHARAMSLACALLSAAPTAFAGDSDPAQLGSHHRAHGLSHVEQVKPRPEQFGAAYAPDVNRPEYGRAEPGRPEFGRQDWGQAGFGRPEFGRPEFGRPELRPVGYDQTALNQPAFGQPEFGPNLHLSTFQTGIPLPSRVDPTLSPSPGVWRISRIATRIGDRNFLVVDKTHGRLVLFLNGAPAFISPALTGTSLADRMPADALSKTYAQELDVKYRVTPAGRFTVSPAYDGTYGFTLDINEIKGKDWTIAIHRVVPGPRTGRLHSPYDDDKHVTEGCINVDPDTMRQLAQLLPRQRATPLYILPMDENLIETIF
jgi:L,D-transpeptidase catalytic domain